MRAIEVFADISCPFTHVGLNRLVAHRAQQGLEEPLIHVRAWPLELVNGAPLAGDKVAPEVDVLRRDVAPDLFAGFRADRLPHTTLPALAAAVAAYRLGLAEGARGSLALRHALFEDGLDVADEAVLDELRRAHAVPTPLEEDRRAVEASYEEGRRRGVTGSPHFFAGEAGFFCPGLDIRHEGGLSVGFDTEEFARFTALAFG